MGIRTVRMDNVPVELHFFVSYLLGLVMREILLFNIRRGITVCAVFAYSAAN